MIPLNYSNLDKETQEHLLTKSKQDVEKWYWVDLKKYALKYNLDYEKLLEEEAQKNLYHYKFFFRI